MPILKIMFLHINTTAGHLGIISLDTLRVIGLEFIPLWDLAFRTDQIILTSITNNGLVTNNIISKDMVNTTQIVSNHKM